MPRNVHIDTVQERVRIEKPAGSHSFSDDQPDGTTTIVRHTTVIKSTSAAKKKKSKLRKALRRFAKKTGLKKLYARFCRFCYEGKSLKLNGVKVRNTNLFYKAGQYIINFLYMLWLTFYGIMRLIMPVVIPVSGVALLIFSGWWLSNYSVAVCIKMDAETLGYVESSEEYDKITAKVARSVAERTGEEYTLDTSSTVELTVIPKNSFSNTDEVYTTLQGIVDRYIGQYYGFFLDGRMIATARNESVFSKLESEILSYYLTGAEDEAYEIVNDLDVIRDSYSKTYIKDYSDLLSLFTKPLSDQTYTVQKGDTLSSIAEEFNLNIPVLKLINGDPSLSVAPGDVLFVARPELQLTVQTVRTISYTEVIPYNTKYIQTDELYVGETQTKNKGSNGSYLVTAEVRSVNGIETSRTEVSKVKTKDAVAQQILSGTKEIVPSGSFIFPLDPAGFYKITSNFGWRTLRGSTDFHRGLDLAANYGTEIYAVDAGTVVEKGNAPSGLGNYVKIDHGNGIISIYGHASSIAKGIKVGVKVYQGQVIAYVGSTGNSTGNHLHLAVYKPSSDEYMDPLPYIKNKLP